MAKIAALVSNLFAAEPRSLPELRITGLSPDALAAIYKLLVAAGASPPAVVWSVARTQMVRCDPSENPAAQLARGLIDPFHVTMAAAVVDGEKLPRLGLFFLRDELSIDYRIGTEWTAARIDALFELLGRLFAVAPTAKVNLEPGLAPALYAQFKDAWTAATAPKS